MSILNYINKMFKKLSGICTPPLKENVRNF